MNKYLLVNYYEDFGRMGSLEGVFLTTQEQLNRIHGKTIYFGEVLGKHSEVVSDECYQHCKTQELDDLEITTLVKIFGKPYEDVLTLSGFNPVEIYLDNDPDEEIE